MIIYACCIMSVLACYIAEAGDPWSIFWTGPIPSYFMLVSWTHKQLEMHQADTYIPEG